MNDSAIQVRRVGKQYRIGSNQERYYTLRDQISKILAAPFRIFQKQVARSETTEFWALRGIDFEIQRGEVVGVIGRNGAGKSTLLKILSRITEPTEGEIDIYGRVGSLLEVGTGFHPELTGRENIYLNGAILGMKRAEIQRKFDEIVSFAEVEKFIDTPVKHYSSGMYMRLAFAVAAHLEPEILIVDEVLAVGDAQFQKKCLGKMGDVAKQGRTVLFVSHNLSQIRTLCTYGIMLDRGELIEQGPIFEIVDNYLKRFSPEALSTIPILPTTIGMHSDHLEIDRIELNSGQLALNGEPFHVDIVLKAKKSIEDLAFGVGFATLEGVRLFTFESDYTMPRIAFQSGEEKIIRLGLDSLPLQPATYLFDFGIRQGSLNGIVYYPGLTQIEVSAGKNTPASIIRAEANGSVRMQATEFTSRNR